MPKRQRRQKKLSVVRRPCPISLTKGRHARPEADQQRIVRVIRAPLIEDTQSNEWQPLAEEMRFTFPIQSIDQRKQDFRVRSGVWQCPMSL